jgi:hypothetical protein
MAWIFLAASEGSPWRWHPGSDQSPTVRTTDTLRRFYCHECETGACQSPPSGTTCGRCAEPIFPRWTLSAAVSPARTSALQALELAWRASEAGLYLNSSASLASADHASSSWRTFQLSLFGGSTAFSWSSMRWGLMRDGRLYQPQKWEPRTCESESGFWPTPKARDWKEGGHASEMKRNDPGVPSIYRETYGERMPATWPEWMMGYDRGHTALEDWATQWFRSLRASRSKGSRVSETTA